MMASDERDAGRAHTNPDSARDVRLMMEHLGADPEQVEAVAPEAMRHAEQACACCPSVARCHRWLEAGGAGDEPEAFCPNVPTFEALAHLAPVKRG